MGDGGLGGCDLNILDGLADVIILDLAAVRRGHSLACVEDVHLLFPVHVHSYFLKQIIPRRIVCHVLEYVYLFSCCSLLHYRSASYAFYTFF